MNFAIYGPIASGEKNVSAYNTNYNDTVPKQYETKLVKTHNNKKVDSQYNASLAMRHITTKGADTDKVYDELSKIFYSQENVIRIQKAIKNTIYHKTRGKFKLEADQDESDLLVAMRAVFLEHARFLPFRLVHQVKELNKRTIEYVIPDMITEIKQAYGYIKEINEPIKPIARPVNVNNAGRRTLPALTSSWGF